MPSAYVEDYHRESARDDFLDAAYAVAVVGIPIDEAILMLKAQYELEFHDPDVAPGEEFDF